MTDSSGTETRALKRRLMATFSGRVQGVGFRFTTVEVARTCAVTGYVQNMMDGSVRLVAEGKEEDVLLFLDRLRASHIFRFVVQESLSWSVAGGEYDAFSIRYA